jgi:hypothetical protein
MKRARAATRKLKTQLGRVLREIERQVTEPSEKFLFLVHVPENRNLSSDHLAAK